MKCSTTCIATLPHLRSRWPTLILHSLKLICSLIVSPVSSRNTSISMSDTGTRPVGRQLTSVNPAARANGAITLRTITKRLQKLAIQQGRVGYIPRAFWSGTVPYTELRTVQTLTQWMPEPDSEQANHDLAHSPSDVALCDCPGCSERIELKYTQLTSAGRLPDFCTSGATDCLFRRDPSGKRLPLLSVYRLVRQCLMRKQSVVSVDGCDGVRSNFVRVCTNCGEQCTTTVWQFFEGRSCLNNACPESLVSFNQKLNVAVENSNHAGIKTIDWLKWLADLGYGALDNNVSGFNNPFTLICARGHQTPQSSFMGVQQFVKGERQVHPCLTCRQQTRWQQLVVSPLLQVGITEAQIQNDPEAFATNVNQERIVVRCPKDHLTAGTIENFVGRLRGVKDARWTCPDCNMQKNETEYTAVVRAQVEKAGAKFVSYDRDHRSVHYQCVLCHKPCQTHESNLARQPTFHCLDCVRSKPEVLAAMTKGTKSFRLVNDVAVLVDGWEGQGLNWLLSVDKVDWQDIVYGAEAMMAFQVREWVNDARVTWVPDAYIHSRAQLVEFKDMDRWLSDKPKYMAKFKAAFQAFSSLKSILFLLQRKPGHVVRVGVLARGEADFTWREQEAKGSKTVDGEIKEMQPTAILDTTEVNMDVDEPAIDEDIHWATTVYSEWQAGKARIIEGKQCRTVKDVSVWIASDGAVYQEITPGVYTLRQAMAGRRDVRIKVHGTDKRVQRGISALMAVAWRVPNWERVDSGDEKWRPRFTHPVHNNLADLAVILVTEHNQEIAAAKRASVQVVLTPEIQSLVQKQAEKGDVAVSEWLSIQHRDVVYRIASGLAVPSSIAKKKQGGIEAVVLAIKQINHASAL